LFARVNHAPSMRNEPVFVMNVSNRERYRIDTDSLILGMTQVFTPNLVNDFRFGASRQATTNHTEVNTGAGARNPNDDEIFPRGYSRSDSLMTISLGPLSRATAILGLVQKNRSSQLQIADNLFYARGSHRWKFGGDYRSFQTAVVVPSLLGIVETDGTYDAD